jgi:hypothetical protein
MAVMREEFYYEFDGEKVLMIQPFMRSMRRLCEEFAESLGEELHHAEIVITTNPSVVQAKGSMHDCDKCRAAVRKALRMLRVNPDQELIVGVLYWAAPRPTVDV